MLLVVVSALVVTTYVNANTTRSHLQTTIGEEFATLARSQVSHLADILAEQLTILQNIALIDEIKRGAATTNARYSGDQDKIETQLTGLDKQWRASEDDSSWVQSFTDPSLNRLAGQLLNYKQTFPNHYRLLLTDRYGGLIATTERTENYYLAQQEWWQVAYNNGDGALYISQPWFDQKTGHTALHMAAPIYSETGQVSGIVLTTFRMNPIYQAVSETGRAALLNAERIVIAVSSAEHPESLGAQMPSSWGTLEELQTKSNWRNLVDEAGVQALAGHASLSGVEIGIPDKAVAIHQLDWVLFVLQAHSEAYAPVSSAARRSTMVAIGFTLAAAALAYFMARTMVSPITKLLEAADSMAAGDLSARAGVRRHDETGQLAQAFNAMAEELSNMVDSLEQRVLERTRNLQTAAEVSRATTSVLNPDELLRQVVDLVRERFRLYYVGLFLLDPKHRYAILQAGTGRAGQEMLAQGHRREVGDESMVGRCLSRGEAQLAFADEGTTQFSNPYLPETRSKMALPLRSRGRVIGAMTVQSREEYAFDEAHVAVMQTMADQVAVAIDNAHLFTETQAALKETEATYQRYVRQAWVQYAPTLPVNHYETRRRGIPPLGDTVLPEIRQAVEQRGATIFSYNDGGEETAHSALVVPITLRGGEIIGALGIHDDEGTRQWSHDQIALIQAITERLALAAENLRLFDETRRRASREQLAHEITDKMRSAIDLDNLLQISIQEISDALDTSSAFVQLTTPLEAVGKEREDEIIPSQVEKE
jgi:GAF domain-containing protein/HAMP domain-containing protein